MRRFVIHFFMWERNFPDQIGLDPEIASLHKEMVYTTSVAGLAVFDIKIYVIHMV